MQNVTVVGFVNVTNFNQNGLMNSSANVKLSRFFGSLNFTNNSAGGNRSIGGPMLSNLSSSLTYYVNGQQITADNQTVQANSKTFTVRLVSEFESTLPSVNATAYTLQVPTASTAD